jgi:hypothetical protein
MGDAVPDAVPFDPAAYAVVLGPSVVALRPDLEDGAARVLEAFLVSWDAVEKGDELERESAIASVSWRLVRYSTVQDAGQDPLVFADSVSGDLLETTRILFDEDGELRDFAGAAGSDLLYFTSLSVEEGYDYFRVAVELLEHVIEQYGGGCFGAAYYRDQMPRLELERALRDRGFARVEDEPLFFVKLELRRPGLPVAS